MYIIWRSDHDDEGIQQNIMLSDSELNSSQHVTLELDSDIDAPFCKFLWGVG
ncbi:predicted protein [Sclerotinia sclerotiorum 1980 UF-70]|uniref:Uncharacterized protein n=1 Tax=Sclerotinia sclerotiorum (strain ATCC 18683 / 1980 / Ss-1) TaxID=665079 RepID=A7EWX8_SCLS1|nr:predicted protein [Sclerotinia sclerotiorum 1980 UF-70]EDN93970.1 predicted protein [Sclerotinia sclerotiorum 1980 UF-70]